MEELSHCPATLADLTGEEQNSNDVSIVQRNKQKLN